MIHLQAIETTDRIPRHEHRVRSFSRDYELITHLGDGFAVDRSEVEVLIEAVVGRYDVAFPDLVVNGRRRADTGQCWAPRWYVVETNGEARVLAWEKHFRRRYPEHGQLRIGATTSLRTLAHELGHHLVHCLESIRTPGHGKIWVGRFDDAMAVIAQRVLVPEIGAVHGLGEAQPGPADRVDG